MVERHKEHIHEMNSYVNEFIKETSNFIEKSLIKEDINLIRKSDGRKKGSCECCKHGSYIYFLFDDLDKIIYIGESGQSVKHRLFTDGTGSHCGKYWFSDVKYLKYYKDDDMGSNVRKLLERVLIAKYNPIYNDGNANKH